jgi:tetratricopeptide (TPR) repeat protein
MGWAYEPLPPTRSSDALRTDIRDLEAAYRAIRPDDTQRRDLLWCLAERNVELEASASNDGSGDAASSARAAAIQYYRVVVSDYPKAERADEVLYDLALEQRRTPDRESALATYRALLAAAPRSIYAPDAHFALGEALATRGSTDPTLLPAAIAEYGEVLKFNAPSTVHGRAWYAMARIHLCTGQVDKARHELDKTLDYVKTFSQFRQGPHADEMVHEAARLRNAAPAEARAGACPYRPSPD